MKKPLIIFGLSNIAEVAYEYFTHDSEYEVVAFTADKNFIQKDQQVFCGLPVVAFEKITEKFNPNITDVFIAVGSKNLNQLRFQKMNKVKQKGYSLASYISLYMMLRSILSASLCSFSENAIDLGFLTRQR